jgi:hypothetical protein
MALLSQIAPGQYHACEDAWTDAMIARCKAENMAYSVTQQDVCATIYSLY